ncbi:MAG TPA: LCP family protein [Ilumatobacteraceae bacterium]|nr:LCP family protein [Ilumatobacteraceae bacterium]
MTDPEPNEPQHFRGHHTAGQRLVLAINCLIVLLCFAGAIGLLIGKHAGENGRKVEINVAAKSATPTAPRPALTAAPGQTLPENTATPETFPPADPQAMNFLVTGADNSTDKSCVQLQDKGARTGERSDTIMVIRLDPVTKRSAILSFPRDLYVKIPGHGTSRINSAYRNNEPQLLIDTIKEEFGVSIDHFIQIDFCAFQKLVTAVGGVTVPLPYAVKDDEIGLDVFDPGCHTFDADEALKYVRSRHFKYRDANGKYHEDPSSDLGRIARQQDFLRRTLTAALNNNLLRPKTIAALYASYRDDVLVDRDLTIDKMIQFVGVVKGVDTADIQTYQIEATGKNVGGSDVLIWHKNSENMQAILNIFRGAAPLANAPRQVFEDTTTTTTLPHTTTSGAAAASAPATPPAGTQPVTTDTAPLSNAPPSAIVPDSNATC